MENQPIVSVILTSYNKPEYLKRAIESVLAQTYQNWQLIIAEDNSPNKDVWNVINTYTDSRIVSFDSLISEEDRPKTARYATQINTAVRNYSKGKYLLYLADDDYYYPDMISTMVAYAESSGHEVVFCAQHYTTNVGEKLIRWVDHPLLKASCVLDHNQVMTTRNAYDKVGGWDDSKHNWIAADAAFWDKLSAENYTFNPINYAIPLQCKNYSNTSVQNNLLSKRMPWRTQEGEKENSEELRSMMPIAQQDSLQRHKKDRKSYKDRLNHARALRKLRMMRRL